MQGNTDSTAHIGTVELARLLEESRRLGEPIGNGADIHPHLATCASCREQFEQVATLDRQLRSLRPATSDVQTGDCPSASVWREIAGGITPADQTLACVGHASRCDQCGPLLRDALAELTVLNRELSDRERNDIASLESARPQWQQRLAQRIAGTLHSERDGKPAPSAWWQKWLSTPRLAMAGASLIAIVSVGSWVVFHQDQISQSLFQRNQPSAATQLLARAYTEKRTLELRIAGAEYAPLRISRGPAASFTDRPAALSKAEALIAGQMESHPSDSSWLQAKAEADLLDGKYDAAVEALRRALELEPNSPSLLIDLATAYSQRAQQEERVEDFGAAYEYLSLALKQRPDDPVALFNRAIVAEHRFLYRQALDDWEHYLRVDSSSQWAEEARNRADAVREKLKQHQSHAIPLLSPAEIVAQLEGASLPSEVEPRIEEYLHEAVRSWLTQAFPVAGNSKEKASETRSHADPQAARALFFLADLSTRQHNDLWLADLLRGSSVPSFPQAIGALARAVQANDAGGYGISGTQAALAERLFRASGNAAGVLRAQFEQTLAEQMTRRSEDCERQATTALRQAEEHSYPWLQIQLGLERSACSGIMGDIGTSEKASVRAAEEAQKSKYGGLGLRALDFVAAAKFETGDSPGAWKLLQVALERYWSGEFPTMHGYNLYQVGGSWGTNEQPNLSMAIWREAAALIDADQDVLLRAWAHHYMADAAARAHRPEIAAQEYTEAAKLFALAPRTDASRGYHLETEIRIAQLEAHLNRFDGAISRLTQIQDQVRPLSNNYLVQMFYSTLGELQLGRHREVDAEQALRPALALAEQSLATIRSEAQRTSWRKDAAPAYLALVEAELLQGRSEEALETYEWYLGAPQRAAPDFRSQRSSNRAITNPPLPDPSQLASRLPLLSNETVLAYAVLPDGLAIWVYDDRGINSCWITKPADGLEELAARFNEWSSDPKSDMGALRQGARVLYGSLIAPVETYLAPGRTLVIEADGWLARVPFEALLDSNGHYLIERVSIVHSLGQDSQARLRNNVAISADLPALVVGSTASSSTDGFIPLPDVSAEADTVASRFRHARVLRGGEATLTRVQVELPEATVFHFAGHAIETQERTGLMLEGGEGQKNVLHLIDAALVRKLHLERLQLAVLSACSTAAENAGSSGFDSVTYALLRAGVPHVVASRWDVDSSETRGFVEDFYRNAPGRTVSDAMRKTSLNMLANPRTAHPYYWSAFAAYGRP